MTTTEIEMAVIDGKKVHWKHEGYTVIKSGENFLIGWDIKGQNPNYTGLNWNYYNPIDFFIAK